MMSSIFNWIHTMLATMISWLGVGSAIPASYHAAAVALNQYVFILNPILPIDVLLDVLLYILYAKLAAIFLRILFGLIVGQVIRRTIVTG